MKKVLVVGGTGTLGKVVVNKLLSKDFQVFVLTRNPEKAGKLSEIGVILIKGDLIQKDSLTKACEGMDVVISAAHSMMGRGKYLSENVDRQGQFNLIDAAQQAKVKYFIFTSVIGAASDHPVDFWRSKRMVETHLEKSGLNYNIIRASAFMEFHLKEMIGKSIVLKGKVTLLGKGTNPTNFVSVQDVAKLMLICIENSEMQNHIIEIGGFDNLTRVEIAEMYAKKAGKYLKISHIPGGAVWFMSKFFKPFHPGLSRIMLIAELFERTDQTFDVQPLLQKYPVTITRVSEFIHNS